MDNDSETLEYFAKSMQRLHADRKGITPRFDFLDLTTTALSAVEPITSEDPPEVAVAAGRRRAMRERVQAASLHRLSEELPVSPSFLPQLFEDAARPQAIKELAKRLA